MNFKEENVKGLIYKKILKEITRDEEVLLRVSKLVYTEEEFDKMHIDVLLSIPVEDLPPDPLDGWTPDFAAIMAAGDKAIAEKSRKRKTKKS